MRQRARVDANQKSITDALRKVGAFVHPIHQLGHGAPDLLVGFRGRWLCLELKDSAKPKSRQRLTKDEMSWHMRVDNRAPIHVVNSTESAIKAIMGG